MPRPAGLHECFDCGEQISQGEPCRCQPSATPRATAAPVAMPTAAPLVRLVRSDTEVIQSRAGHRRTLAELNAHGRVLSARTLLISACVTLETAKKLVDSATTELHAAEAEELAAMRAAVEGPQP